MRPASLCRLLMAVLAAVLALLPCSLQAEPGDDAGAASAPWSAERLYREGIRADGSALRGIRSEGAALDGEAAACVNCHRRSGFGISEGKSQIPPISAEFLFHNRTANLPQPDAGPTPGAGGIATDVQKVRRPYDPQTIARALREGINSDGRPMSVLMPRYALDDREMAALIDYLRTLGTGTAPGVDEGTLHFATIVTPDADPRARDAMLATLRQFFQDRSHIIAGEARPMAHNDRGILYRVTRKWELHVWELQGAPADWEAQLRQFQAARPVFAVISGLGGATWAPVHRFCETSRLPCLFPNADVPVLNEHDFFTLYFSRGVLLEAALMADDMAGPAPAASAQGRRLIQVTRAGGAGEAAARQLSARMAGAGWEVDTRVLAPGDSATRLARAVEVGPQDVLALWLAPEDVSALPGRAPAAARIYLSGLLSGLEQTPLPDAWRASTELSYPLELPERRALAMRLPEGWFHIKQLALSEPRIQLQTYVACQILSEMIGELHINFVPEYLIERTEVMLSHRRFNGMYPRLSLGAGQRFASKGGYLVHLSAPGQVSADGDWRIPP